MKLLTIGNPKMAKAYKLGYLTAVLHLAPATLSGHNVCPFATAGCIASCLNTAGRGGIMKAGETSNAIQRCRINRTKLFYDNRATFLELLRADIRKVISMAKRLNLKPSIRLNGTSDILWERVAPAIFAEFPTVRFYDYTKAPAGLRSNLPANYHLTYSRAEGNNGNVAQWLEQGSNVAVVFATKRGAPLPAEYMGRKVIDGDETDLRFLDPAAVIVGLRAKGKARKDASGFVVQNF